MAMGKDLKMLLHLGFMVVLCFWVLIDSVENLDLVPTIAREEIIAGYLMLDIQDAGSSR